MGDDHYDQIHVYLGPGKMAYCNKSSHGILHSKFSHRKILKQIIDVLPVPWSNFSHEFVTVIKKLDVNYYLVSNLIDILVKFPLFIDVLSLRLTKRVQKYIGPL